MIMIFAVTEKGKKQMDNYAEILILIAGMWLGYLINDMRRDMKEWKEQAKKDRERKEMK